MAVLHTQKIRICALKRDRSAILTELQRMGAVQIETDGSPDDIFARTDTASDRTGCDRKAKDAEAALRALNTYAPEKTGLFSSLEGKKVLARAQYEEHLARIDETAEAAEQILALQKEIGDARASAVRAQMQKESLTPWLSLDVPLSYPGTEKTTAFIGTLPGRWSLEEIPPALTAVHDDLSAYTVEIVGTDREQTCIFAVCANAEAKLFEDALRNNGFIRPSLQTPGVPADEAKEQQRLSEEALEQEKQAIEGIRGLAHKRDDLRFAADYFTMEAAKYETLGELLQSERTFFIDGYVPENRAAQLKDTLSGRYTCEIALEAPDESDDAPVLLKNNAFASPTESVVAAFGLPAKGEIDPTSIMAFFYYFLFGLMLSDAGYGLVMVIGCALALKKFPGMDDGLKKMLRMFFYCGISTVCWGVLFGGYFGDVVTVVAETWFHTDITIPALWFVPLNDPMKLLMFSFLFGIIHLFVGLGAKGYMLLRDHAYFDFFSGVLCWYVLLIALILMLLPSDMFASMAGVTIVFPAVVGPITKWAAIVAAVCIVLFSEMGTKNIAVRIALGAYDLYGVSSWLSDVLSYSRLLALGLATGVIGTVINTMGSMIGDGPIAFVLFWIIFVVGHTLNMAINLLGAYVHTNRLQFVEFFGKFYEGGGRPFRPFSTASNKYFKFKEEN